jgi:cytochrome c peroxidase
MKFEPGRNLAEPGHRQGGMPTSKRQWLRRNPILTTLAVTLSLLCGLVAAGDDDRDGGNNGNSPAQLRQLIDRQVGGIEKLMVPAKNADIPVPAPRAGTPPEYKDRYKTTEAKRYLGKLLFHDPVRTARINANQGQPVDLPVGTAFGGTLNALDPKVPSIIAATKQTGSCASCHFAEAATKAGAQINLHVGAEGFGYTDEDGNFIVRRRTQEILVKKRSAPIFPGDTLVDALPTLTDIDIIRGARTVATPSPWYHLPESGAEKLLATGRLDELDSVGRQSPSVIGFAFNNRLLLGGFGGELPNLPGSVNPFNDPAQENLTLLLLDAHRMLNFQSAELMKIPAFVKLFRDAFPEEAAKADSTNNMGELINDQTVFRATSTFLRTAVTRNTPFDRFLAGEERALTASQRRGARLFFTPATNGQGGAGCVACHSGPMLNKQINDPDVAGIGQFVEENFINVGRGDHPVQALNALERGRLNPNVRGPDGFAYHAEDTGRQEITMNPNDAFKFRSLTLRQLKDAGNFFHDGTLTKIRDVVEYFNAGIPADRTAGQAKTLDIRFTNPRGPGYPAGLGLSKRDIEDLTNFLEDGLYDPAFRKYDPKSSTDAFAPHERDLTYSKYRPDLAALGAKDGMMLSGLGTINNDPLSRRDQGLEFLDVTTKTAVALIDSDRKGNDDRRQEDVYKITNSSSTIVDTHLLVIARGLPEDVRLVNASGTTKAGDPYRRIFLPSGVLMPGQSINVKFRFKNKEQREDAAPLKYTLTLLSGQGNP